MPTTLPKGKANTDSWDDEFNGLYSVDESDCPLLQSTDGCKHKWEVYNGFNTSFEYCTKCDKKKETK